MRNRVWMIRVLAAGCGGGGESGPELLEGFNPEPPTTGQIQVITPIIEDIPAGADLTLCTYLDFEDADGFDITNYEPFQSGNNHHNILYAVTNKQAPNTHPCTEEDMLTTRYLGGGGGDAPPEYLPPGIVFRVPAATQLMIQTHWVNATDEIIRGQAAFNLDVQAQSAEVEPADLFAVANTQIAIDPGVSTARSVCTVPRDMQFFLLGGHQHHWGTGVSITRTPPGGATEVIYEVAWAPEYEFNPPRNAYTREEPFVVHAGDTLAIDCEYMNDTGDVLRFPTEMCIIFGYYFPADQGEIHCIDGFFPQ